MSVRSLGIAARRSLTWIPLALSPVLLLAAFVHDSRKGVLAFDFRIGLTAASKIIHGLPIYAKDYVYPPFYAESLTPFLLLPADVAAWIAAVGSVAIFIAGLWSLGVRDLRALGVALCSAPVIHGSEVANATFLVFGLLALAWRAPRIGLGFAVTFKFVAWPFLVWQAMAKGVRTAVASALIAVGLILGSWALIDFEGLRGYPSLLNRTSASQGGFGYSVAGAFTGGRWVAAALTLAALARCWSRVRNGDDVGGFAYAVGAMLTGTTYVFDNYFICVFLPLALRRPNLSPAWLVPLGLWASVARHPTLEAKAIVWMLFGGLIVWLGEGAIAFRHGGRRLQAATRSS